MVRVWRTQIINFQHALMRISQKLDYAQRAVLQLAKCYDEKSVSRLDDIAQQEGIPSSFLVQILSELRNANIVISKRGKTGGYLLARSPAEISLREVIEVIEPQLVEDTGDFVGASSAQELSSIWKELSDGVRGKLSKVSLEDLCSSDREPMWFI